MKKLLLLTLLCTITLLQAALPARKAECSGKQAQFKAVRIIAAPGNKIAAFAAKEAELILKQTGIKVKIGKQSDPAALNVVIGVHPDFPESKASLKDIPDGGYRIIKKGNTVCIFGTDTTHKNLMKETNSSAFGYSRGSLYGLYEFLERFAGVRLYFPGKFGTIVPKKPLALPETIDLLDYPDWQERHYLTSVRYGGKWYSGTPDYKRPDQDLLQRLRLRGNTIAKSMTNSLNRANYLERYWKSNPEYFAVNAKGIPYPKARSRMQTQFCLFSGIEEVIFQDCKAYFEGKPASSCGMKWWSSMFSPAGVNLTHDDAFAWCQCPKCRKIADASKIYTDPAVRKRISTEVWKFTGRIAQRLKDEKVPNAHIIMLAYNPYDVVPDCEIPDNVTVVVVVFPGIQSDCAKQRFNDMRLKAWREKCKGPVLLRAWPGKYMSRTFPGVPAMHHNLLIDYFTKRAGWFCGGFLDEGSDYAIFRHLNLYLFSRHAWNQKCDLKAVLDEYFTLMFGKGAPFIRKFYDEMERIWDKELVKASIDDALGGNAVVAGYRETWQVIFSNKRIAEFDKLFADALKAAADDKDACERIVFIRDELYGVLRQRQQEFAVVQKAQKNWKISPGETIWLRPRKGQIAEVETRVTLEETKDSFIFRFFCEEPEMKRLQARVKGRDTNLVWEDSDMEILLNPSGDMKTFFQWCINANGAVDDISSKEGIKWNSKAKIEVKRGEKSWQGTVTIPKAELGDYKKDGFPIAFTRCRALEAPGAMPKERFYCFLPNPTETRNSRDPEYWGRLDLSGKPDKNLVQNGNFKELKTLEHKKLYRLWTAAPEAQSITLDRSTFVTMGQSVKLQTKEPKRINFQFHTKGIKPDKRYRISYFLRTENVEGWGITASLDFGKGVRLKLNERPIKGTNPWHRLSYDITTPASYSVANPGLSIGSGETTGRFWIDEARIEELP